MKFLTRLIQFAAVDLFAVFELKGRKANWLNCQNQKAYSHSNFTTIVQLPTFVWYRWKPRQESGRIC